MRVKSGQSLSVERSLTRGNVAKGADYAPTLSSVITRLAQSASARN